MSKTIRKIAEELKITKQAVSQRMDAIDGLRKNHTKMIGNRIMVDESGERLIVNFEKLDKYNHQEHQQEDHQERKGSELDALIHQLSVKDTQIKELQDELLKQQEAQIKLLNENGRLIKKIDHLSIELNEKRHKHWKLWNN